MKKNKPQRKTMDNRIRLLGLAGLVVLSFALGGYQFIHALEQASIRDHYAVLDTIGRMKTEQILAWRSERLADARMNSSGLIRTLVQDWHTTGKAERLAEIRARMETFRENEGYQNMILADTSGIILVSLVDKTELPPEAGAPPLPQQHKQIELTEDHLIERILSSREATLGDFYSSPPCKRIHIRVGAPVMDTNNQIIAVLLLIADPATNLLPLLQVWPGSQGNESTPQIEPPSKGVSISSFFAKPLLGSDTGIDAHGVSLLFRKEKNSILFLSPLLSSPTPAFTLSHTDNPAVRAVLGETGMVQGKDCFGEEVLTDLRPVPGTAWYLVTKTNLKGLLARARLQGGGVLLLFALAMGMTAALVRLITVSRQKTMSEALLQSERERNQTREEIRATLYGIGDGVIATDAEGRVTRMNPEAERLTGWQEKESIGRPLATVFNAMNEENEDPVVLPITRVLLQGETIGVSNHVVILGRNGLRWPITDSWSPIRDAEGKITGVVLVFRDQTKRKIMEKARAESAKRYSDLVESVHDLIWETGPDFCFTFVSRHATNMLGYRPEEIIGQFWDILLSPEEIRAKNTNHFAKNLASRKPYSQHCQTLIRKDGNKVIFESSATPVFDKQERFLGYRGVSRDITERLQTEEEQKKLQAQLLQAQKMDTVGRLAGGIAHDFNNMLTVICSYVEMTLNDLGKEHPLYKRLFEVHLAAQHSANLTRQLLAFARKQVISPRVLDLNQTIDSTLKMLHRLIGENIRLLWIPGSDLWPVQMDATQISQILANLVINARDAIDGAGHITIETSNVVLELTGCIANIDLIPGEFVLMSIMDDGSGIDKKTLSSIFEPFFTTKEEGKGTGLGLATVYGIVKQNKGMIDVASEPGNGTTFKIYLPKVPLDAEIFSAENGNAERQGNETILLVEDESAILELGTYVLEERGYTVLTAPTPVEALNRALAHKGPIDLLITDVIMPEMNGRELAKNLLEIRPQAKVLYISGYTSDILSDQGGLETGIHFLEKPFSGGALELKVREVLDQGCPVAGTNSTSPLRPPRPNQ